MSDYLTSVAKHGVHPIPCRVVGFCQEKGIPHETCRLEANVGGRRYDVYVAAVVVKAFGYDIGDRFLWDRHGGSGIVPANRA